MADPISLVALGAAVGGAAGKLTETVWDSASDWLRERFGSHAEAAREHAKLNAAAFVRELAYRVKSLEDAQRVTAERVATTQGHPQFALMLQHALLNSAQTNDSQKHRLLARLVAERLATYEETTLALASQLAVDAVGRATRRQLELLGVSCFIDEVRPGTVKCAVLSRARYREWLEVHLAPFAEFEFKEIDAKHLVAISCISFDPRSERSLRVLLLLKNGPEMIGKYDSGLFDGWSAVELLEIQWAEGLSGVQLTSVGSLIGGLVLDEIFGVESKGPSWA